jgi:hypothetical protein
MERSHECGSPVIGRDANKESVKSENGRRYYKIDADPYGYRNYFPAKDGVLNAYAVLLFLKQKNGRACGI